jgi:hypothetical protein
MREFGGSRIDRRLARLHPDMGGAAQGLDVSTLHSRLFHYINFPAYNRVVLSKAAADCGVSESELLASARHYFNRTRNRFTYGLEPLTHGQHYHDVWHEMREWRLDRWREYFAAAGFTVERIAGYRYHHLFEATPSPLLNSLLYFHSAGRIHRWIARGSDHARASEIIILARRP